MKDFLRRRVYEPLLAQLRAGVTPDKLAMSVAVGAVIGTFPVLGSTTVMGLLCGALFRLNHLAVQVLLNITYPLQLVFLIPLLSAGGKLLDAPVPSSLDAMRAQLDTGVWATVQLFARASAGAILVWLVLAVPTIFALRLMLRPAIAKALTRAAVDPPLPEEP